MIRLATSEDYDAIGQLMFDAVRTGPSPYTDAQRAAWVDEPRSGPYWHERLKTQMIWLSEHEGRIDGFMSLIADTGYIDLAFIQPDARGKGLFRLFCSEIEDAARAAGRRRLWTHASLMAEPAFSAMGFAKVEREEVTIGDQSLARYLMEKAI